MAKQVKILSVGGSIIIPKEGFDISFIKKFRTLIMTEIEKGTKFILVIGGGNTARMYQDGLRNMGEQKNVTLDWMGIDATIINAKFVKYIFGDVAYKDVITNPNKKISTSKSLIIAAGEKPGQSSDMAAVRLAKTFGASEVLNLSNIAYVYDKDPNKYDNAQKIESINWASFRRDIVGNEWIPGKNVPFDPTAAKGAQKLGLMVKMVEGTSLRELKKALRGDMFKGTVIR